MFSLLVDSNGNYIKPHQEHSIRDFKGKGNAMCTEYAVMAQNILRMFDFESYYIVGNLSFNDDKSESHAFNIVSFVDQDTGEYKDAVIDFINGIKIYDMDFNVIGDEPFIGFIDNLDQDFADRFFGGEEHLTFEEYSYCILGDSFFKLVNEDKSREYSVDNMVYANEDVNNNKIYTLKKSPML